MFSRRAERAIRWNVMPLNYISIDGTDYDSLPVQWEPQHGPRMRAFDTLPLGRFVTAHRVYGRERANEPQSYRVTWDLMEVAMADVLRILFEQQVEFVLEATDIMGRTIDAAPTQDLTGDLTEYFGPTYPWKSGTVTVYKNDVEQGSGFSLHLDRGSVEFDSPLGGGDVVTVKYDWQLAAARLDMLRLVPIEVATLYEVEAILAEVP